MQRESVLRDICKALQGPKNSTVGVQQIIPRGIIHPTVGVREILPRGIIRPTVGVRETEG